MEFDQPLLVALVNECELVRVGFTTMLAEHADRVSVVPAGHPMGDADIALVDPYTLRAAAAAPRDARRLACRVAVYTWEIRNGYVERAMLDGADGYLSKTLPAAELVAALEKVHAGERIVAVDEPRPSLHDRRMPEGTLTPRESDVISLIAAGVPNKEISRRLELSMNTIKSHIRTAYRSMGVTSRTQAVLWAVEHGITAPRVADWADPAA